MPGDPRRDRKHILRTRTPHHLTQDTATGFTKSNQVMSLQGATHSIEDITAALVDARQKTTPPVTSASSATSIPPIKLHFDQYEATHRFDASPHIQAQSSQPQSSASSSSSPPISLVNQLQYTRQDSVPNPSETLYAGFQEVISKAEMASAERKTLSEMMKTTLEIGFDGVYQATMAMNSNIESIALLMGGEASTKGGKISGASLLELTRQIAINTGIIADKSTAINLSIEDMKRSIPGHIGSRQSPGALRRLEDLMKEQNEAIKDNTTAQGETNKTLSTFVALMTRQHDQNSEYLPRKRKRVSEPNEATFTTFRVYGQLCSPTGIPLSPTLEPLDVEAAACQLVEGLCRELEDHAIAHNQLENLAYSPDYHVFKVMSILVDGSQEYVTGRAYSRWYRNKVKDDTGDHHAVRVVFNAHELKERQGLSTKTGKVRSLLVYEEF